MENNLKFIVARLIQKWLSLNSENLKDFVYDSYIKQVGKKIDEIYIEEEIKNFFTLL
jgi:hypothetical protein